MDKISGQKIWFWLAGFLIFEALSFLTYSLPAWNGAVLILAALAVIAVSIYRLEYGLLLVIGELLIGSLGHLFFIDLSLGRLPLRIAVWLSFMAVFAIKFAWHSIKAKRIALPVRLSRYLWILSIFIIVALINGLARGYAYSLILADFNAWLFFLLVIPALYVYGAGNKEKIVRLKTLFIAAAIWMSLKTLIFLYIFSHDAAVAPAVYTWLRKTLSGEMTPTLAGWPRIFIQGQIYAGVAYFVFFWSSRVQSKFRDLLSEKNLWFLLGGALFLSTLIISFSRSFWVGLLAAAAFSLALIWRSDSWRKVWEAVIWLSVSLVFSLVIIYAVAAFPYIAQPVNFGASFLNRVSDGGEAAVASRWSLLPVLMDKIMEEPVLGQGYGATVTYISSDPRVLQTNSAGLYTTYAFEWGYLDLWLKLGILGLAAYLLLLFMLIKDSILQGRKNEQILFFSLASGLVFLAVVNIFTPYLNHPLGIGLIVMSSCLIAVNRIY